MAWDLFFGLILFLAIIGLILWITAPRTVWQFHGRLFTRNGRAEYKQDLAKGITEDVRAISSFVGGYLALLLAIGVPILSVYLLVRFIHWAWVTPFS